MADAHVSNGECLSYDDCARLGDVEQDYIYVTLQQSKSLGAEHIHACHGMIFAKSQRVLWEQLPVRACVLMHMRFDGVLGFPGGLVDDGEDPIVGLNRELEEEIGVEMSKHGFTAEDHVETAVHQRKKLVLHFFVKEVTEEQFCLLEKGQQAAPEYGIESLGIVRVPLYTMPDGLRGFPAFLTNQFIGNARHQLLTGLSHCQLLTPEEIQAGVARSDQYRAQSLRADRQRVDA